MNSSGLSLVGLWQQQFRHVPAVIVRLQLNVGLGLGLTILHLVSCASCHCQVAVERGIGTGTDHTAPGLLWQLSLSGCS